ncbi:MAG: glycosyltransferase [Kiritimatiellae bacterium]|nr:glycosyltransferase [Kiritimatiellia bacterium]MDW8458685.1 glycosyltransferase [Verrucomicrobiota bacterium]
MKEVPSTRSEPPITIITPARDYGYFIRDAIESVLEQMLDEDEYIVIDDGSTDDTPAILREYRDRVRYLRTPGIGANEVRRFALDHIRTTWFFNLDADNLLGDGALMALRTAAAKVQNDRSVAFLYPSIRRLGLGVNKLILATPVELNQLKLRNHLDGNALYRTAIAREIPFDPQFPTQDDYDFFLSAYERGYRGEPVPEAILIYRLHSGSISQTVSRSATQKNTWRAITSKHKRLYTPSELRKSRTEINNRIRLSIIHTRSPFASLTQRIRGLWVMAKCGCCHAEMLKQLHYTCFPSRYYSSVIPTCDIFYFLTPSYVTRELLDLFSAGMEIPREELLGLAGLFKWDVRCDNNLRYAHITLQSLYSPPNSSILFKQITRIAWQASRAKLIVADSAEIGLHVLALAIRKCWKNQIVVWWRTIRNTNSSRLQSSIFQSLSRADRIIVSSRRDLEFFSKERSLRERVLYVEPFIDHLFWRPINPGPCSKTYDILCIGERNWLDIGLIQKLASSVPNRSFAVHILDGYPSEAFSQIKNLEYFGPVSFTRIRDRMATARLVLIPVLQDQCSKCLTWILRAVALGRTVVVSGPSENEESVIRSESVFWTKSSNISYLVEIIETCLQGSDRESHSNVSSHALRKVYTIEEAFRAIAMASPFRQYSLDQWSQPNKDECIDKDQHKSYL